ncbi:MAG: hypothetical protein IPH22_13760 [Nitrosomonas sp.]|nr:hypothetical protein [Nitrosomonas sp.]
MFLLLRDEINEAIDDGWSVKYIWEVLSEEGKITFSYQTFLNLVNKYKTNSSLQSKTIIAKKNPHCLILNRRRNSSLNQNRHKIG